MTRPRGAVVAMSLTLVASACGGGRASARRTDVPEPAVAGELAIRPVGRIVPVGIAPEGLAFDVKTGILAVAVRQPDGVALVDGATGALRVRVPLAGAARHLELAGPGGPVLVPSEGNDRLYEIALPDGGVVADRAVGRQPHDAAVVAGGSIVVGDELADTLHVLAPDGTARVGPAPAQPGGVAASRDGSTAVVVGVRGRTIEAFSSDGRSLGTAPCGIGPTHVRAGEGSLFYVADTQGGAVLVFETGPKGITEIGRVPTGAGTAPYGLAVDARRKLLYITLTASNQLRSFRIDGRTLKADRSWPAVRQPNDVAVDEVSGRVVVAGTADGVLQILDP